MKVFGFLAVLAAGIVSVASGSAHAMPITLNFSGAILDPSECSSSGVLCNPKVYDSSPGGIFAGGQSVAGSMVYDPANLAATETDPSGFVTYFAVGRNLSFSVNTGSGPYAAQFASSVTDRAMICGAPACPGNGRQFVSLVQEQPTVAPPPVIGAELGGAGLFFLSDNGPLSSSALLPSSELLSFIEKSEVLFLLALTSADKCDAFAACFAWAKVSVSAGDPSTVPEPAGAGLMGIGLVGLIALRRRKKATA